MADMQERVVIDGNYDQPYTNINKLVISSDSKRIAYLANDETHQWLIIDGKRTQSAENSRARYSSDVVFSPDGKHVAYTLPADDQIAVVVDSRRINVVDRLRPDSLLFRPDGKSIAYATHEAIFQDSAKIADITNQPEQGGRLVWAGDALCYPLRVDKNWFVMIGAKKLGPFDDVGINGAAGISVGRLPGAYAVTARTGKEWWIITHQAKYGPYANQPVMTSMSDSGSRVLFMLKNDNERHSLVVMANGKRICEVEHVERIVAAPKGDEFALIGWNNGKSVAVLPDGTTQVDVSQYTFSPDGKRRAAVRLKNDVYVVEVDGKPGTAYKEIVEGPVFSPNSAHIAYWGRTDDKYNWALVVDNTEVFWSHGRPVHSAAWSGDAIVRGAIFRYDNASAAQLPEAKGDAKHGSPDALGLVEVSLVDRMESQGKAK